MEKCARYAMAWTIVQFMGPWWVPWCNPLLYVTRGLVHGSQVYCIPWCPTMDANVDNSSMGQQTNQNVSLVYAMITHGTFYGKCHGFSHGSTHGAYVMAHSVERNRPCKPWYMFMMFTGHAMDGSMDCCRETHCCVHGCPVARVIDH